MVGLYGYDTKFAMHALRRGLQGIEVMTTGHLAIPVPEPDRSTLRAVRGGNVSMSEALALIADAEKRLHSLVDSWEWEADLQVINSFMTMAPQAWWDNHPATGGPTG